MLPVRRSNLSNVLNLRAFRSPANTYSYTLHRRASNSRVPYTTPKASNSAPCCPTHICAATSGADTVVSIAPMIDHDHHGHHEWSYAAAAVVVFEHHGHHH